MRKLRILVYGINYAPELTGIGKYTGEMAEWLAARGHQVRVVTAPPFSPGWHIYEGFSGLRYSRDEGAVPNTPKVIRCPVWVPRNPAGVNRLLHLLSFGVSSIPAVATAVSWSPDVVWVVEPSCVFMPAALLLARLSGAKTWLHVQDFEIDMAFGMGLLPGSLQKPALAVERWLMRRCDRVSTISMRMMDLLEAKLGPSGSCVLFPNWVDTRAIYPMPGPNPLRSELGIPPSAVVALYSGNMARKQGLDSLVRAVQLACEDGTIHAVICGDGPARHQFDVLKGVPNVHLLGLQPVSRLNELLNVADIHLLPQSAGTADLVMPSKLTSMLATGRPVIATVHPATQVAEVVTRCGIVVPPGDAFALSQAIRMLALQPALRDKLGAEARSFALKHLNADSLLAGFEQELLNVCDSKRLERREKSVASAKYSSS